MNNILNYTNLVLCGLHWFCFSKGKKQISSMSNYRVFQTQSKFVIFLCCPKKKFQTVSVKTAKLNIHGCIQCLTLNILEFFQHVKLHPADTCGTRTTWFTDSGFTKTEKGILWCVHTPDICNRLYVHLYIHADRQLSPQVSMHPGFQVVVVLTSV